MGLSMLLPAYVDFYKNNPDFFVFLYTSSICLIISSLVWLATKGSQARFTPRLGFLLINCLWIMAIFVGSLPFYFSHVVMNFTEAIFETASGLTTTGATVLVDLDHKPYGVLLWRSLLCWLGGLGIIALALLLLPSLRVGGSQLFYMESSDKSEKILPRIQQISNGIGISYLGITILCMICYHAAGMTFFDAVNHAFTTVATAGFSTHDASIGYYNSTLIVFISAIFMFLSAIPFVLYVKLISFGRIHIVKDPQVILFSIIVWGTSFVLAVWLHMNKHIPFLDAFVVSAFHFISVITTTGYAFEDYTLWGPFSFGLFFAATYLGGCAGSTSGGIKINRLIILWRYTKVSLLKLIAPHRVAKVYYGESEVSLDVINGVLLFVSLYMFSLLAGAMLLVMTGLDFASAFSGALTALSNVGPGFGDKIGPIGNFASINSSGLWVLTFLMLIGRLEIVTTFVLFLPAFWKTR